MNKLELANWLIKRIGSKVDDLRYNTVSDDVMEILGGDIDSYLSVLSDIVKETLLP